MKDKSLLLDGPIPGANYTSDTRNYPWHRPPEYTTLDDCIEHSVKRLTKKEGVFGILSMLANGVTVAALTDIFVTSGISKGKWTPDFAILLAGPVARIIKMLADGYGIEYRTGIEENDDRLPTEVGVKAMIDKDRAAMVGADVAGATEEIQDEAEDIISEEDSAPTGLMGISMDAEEEPADEEEQNSMLGYGADETEEDLPMNDDEEVLV